MKETFLIIHGMGGNKSDHWYPWLKKELENLDNTVILETFPDNLKAQSETSISFTKDLVHKVKTSKINLITHSSAAAIALHIAEIMKVNMIYIISGLFQDLGFEDEIKSGLFKKNFDFEKIKSNTAKIIQIDSDNDPYIPNQHFDELSKKLNSIHLKLPNRRHFGDPQDSPKEFIELLNNIKVYNQLGNS